MSSPLTLMVVHAHPDDEVLSTGGLLAKYSQQGVRTILVTCTNGELGEINDPTLDPEAVRDRLAELRLAELQASAKLLGISQFELLGYRDSGMMGTEDNEHPESFWKADLDEAAGKLVRLIRQYRPHVLVTYDENGNYGHPDHINANRITTRAFAAAGDPAKYPDHGLEPWQPLKLYWTAWSRERGVEFLRMMEERGIEFPWRDEDSNMEEWGLPSERINVELDVRSFVPLKLEALKAHRTQIGPDWFVLTLPMDVAEAMLGWESFVRVECRVPVAHREGGLFDGIAG